MASWRFVPWLILNPVILQVACALAVLLGSSMSIAPTGPAQALFKTVNRFVPQLELLGVSIIVISLAVVDVVCAIIEQRAVNRSFNKIIERRFRQCR